MQKSLKELTRKFGASAGGKRRRCERQIERHKMLVSAHTTQQRKLELAEKCMLCSSKTVCAPPYHTQHHSPVHQTQAPLQNKTKLI